MEISSCSNHYLDEQSGNKIIDEHFTAIFLMKTFAVCVLLFETFLVQSFT